MVLHATPILQSKLVQFHLSAMHFTTTSNYNYN